MTDQKKLYDGIGKAAWGYLFIYVNINLGTVNVLPAFVGDLLFFSAINDLCGEERELKLLRPLVGILTVWRFADWIAAIASVELVGVIPFVDIIFNVIHVYFHFQLITNLASIAAKHQINSDTHSDVLLGCRTFQTVLQTAALLLLYLTKQLTVISIYSTLIIAMGYLIAGIILMSTLFNFRRCFADKIEEITP